ncbi:hypothetical protein HOO68_03270 [Candidatus Gracilibacteria bacterium]|nr:hypothetical protein [Candidatus Gracilibacteria bacterium]
MVSHSAAMRRKVIPAEEVEVASSNQRESQVYNLILSIKKSILISNGQQLGEDLNALSAIFRIQAHETIIAHNGRISELLGGLRKNVSDTSWSTKIQVLGVLKDVKGRAIESQEKFVIPSVGMFMETPISHDGNVGRIQIKPSIERELLLLKIYGIDIGEISRILDSKKNK